MMKIPLPARLALVFALATLTSPPTLALDLHVATDGNDAWSGRITSPNAARTDGPLASLTGARDAVRKLKAQAPPAEPIRILVATGKFTMTEPLVLTPEDSGTATASVSYEAAPGATPVFSGGRRLTGWQPGPNGIWQTQVPEVAAGQWYFEQLWVNGQRATRARTPNKFWHPLLAVQEERLVPGPTKRPTEARQTVTVRPADFAAVADLTAAELRDVNFIVYHNWDNTRRFIERVDPEKQTIVTTGEGMKPWNPWRRNSTWIVENARRFLDAPGEWFLARDGTLFYQPRPGEDLATAEVVAPVAEKFLVFKGDPAAGRFIEHLALKGLVFHHAQYLTPPGGFEPNQAAALIDAAVIADGVRNLTLENCEIGHLGTYAVWFRRGCRDVTLRHCEIHDFGAGGVRIGETSMPAKESEQTSHIVVDNNIIRHGGSIFPCAVGVWIGFSPDNQVTHNEIADLFYSGISMGWRWGYEASNCKRNTVAFNHIHHLGKGLLSDMGGIYTLGPSEGSVVANNVFHDIEAYSYGGWGLYTDEGSTGILFENNLVYATKTGSFHQHYGKENIIRNNIFVESRLHQLQATRVEPHRSFTLEHNLIYWTNASPALSGPWSKVNFIANNNCYWNPTAQVTFLGKPLAEWQAAGHEQGTLVADPLFVDPAARDFRLRSESPALQLGFKPFDPTQAGVYGVPEWLAKAKSITYPPLEAPPPPEP